MATLLRMPEVSADTTEATLLAWAVSENVAYAAADTIVTLETAKAVVDIAAEADGVILRRLVTEGTDVKVGEPIALLGAPGERVEDVEAALSALGVVGLGPRAGALPEGSGLPAEPQPWRVFASPLARRLAREAGIGVDGLTGTGPGGRIIRRDVEAATASGAVAPPVTDVPVSIGKRSAAATSLGVESVGVESVGVESTGVESVGVESVGVESTGVESTGVSSGGGAAYRVRPHSRARLAIAERLTHSTRTAPHFYLRAVVRADRLLKLRARLNRDDQVRVSVNDLLVKAVAGAHQRVPAMNVTWAAEGVREYTGVDVAVAVATPGGLLTPVLRGVDRLGVTGVAAATKDVADRARSGRLRQHELEGGSITVTNLGMYGTSEFAAVINPPHASILAVGAATAEPVVNRGRIRPATVIRVTLSVDHRPVDGAVAAQWMAAFVALVEDPLRILA